MDVPDRPLQLTARDLAVLEMVRSYHGCTTEQIHARFWRRGSSPSACYRRIALLVNAGYLAAHRLPALSGVGSGKRFLTLGTLGRGHLARREGTRSTTRPVHEAVTPLFAEHHLAIGDFRIALELAAGLSTDVQLLDWTTEAKLRGEPLRVEDTSHGGTKGQVITVVPDGVFTLNHGSRHQRCLLEMDMGTIAPRRLRLKIRGYLLVETPYILPVFFVVPGESRAMQLSQMVCAEAKSLSRTPSTFFITTRHRVTPETILFFPIWEQVGVSGRRAIIRSSDGSMHQEAVR